MENYIQIARQVQKVISVLEESVDFLRKVVDRVLVGNVSYHDGCPRVVAYFVNSDFKHISVEGLRSLLVLVLVTTVVKVN